MWNASAPIVVGVDGSVAAINAALWAIDEAISRDVPLRIVHVIHIGEKTDHLATTTVSRCSTPRHRCARPPLRWKVTGKRVKVETEILWGPANPSLIDESRNAAMICVGIHRHRSGGPETVRIDSSGARRRSICAVARSEQWRHPPTPVIGSSSRWMTPPIMSRSSRSRWGKPGCVKYRYWLSVCGAGVSAKIGCDELDRRVDDWQQRYPEVHIYRVAADVGIDRFVAENRNDTAQLAVVGAAEAHRITQIVGPHGHSLVPHGECSVLVAH